MRQQPLPERGSVLKTPISVINMSSKEEKTCCILCENKAHMCQHVCVIIQWMEEFNPPPPHPPLEIKAINAAQDVGNEVMEAERPELAARGASALSNNTQLQAGCSHADQTDRHCRTQHQTWGAALSPW